MKNNILLNRMLIDLFKASEGLYSFTLYKRYNVPPSKLFLVIDELLIKNIIINEDGRLSLTNEGKEYMINNNISLARSTDKYSKIPEQFIGRKIGINEFYLPSSANIKNDLLS